jgi:hypothetical protein
MSGLWVLRRKFSVLGGNLSDIFDWNCDTCSNSAHQYLILDMPYFHLTPQQHLVVVAAYQAPTTPKQDTLIINCNIWQVDVMIRYGIIELGESFCCH